MTITVPGVYELDVDVYHADPVEGGSLSSTGARKLIPPSCPARFDYERHHRPKPTDEFNFGHAVHKLVLGAGAALVPIDADDYKTKAAREQRDQAFTDGLIPILPKDLLTARAMADAVKRHPLAAALLADGRGKPEQAMFWRDAETGIWCRGLIDWLPNPGAGRLMLVDYKTSPSAAPDKFERSMHDYGYGMQAAWYLDGATALGLSDAPRFLFIVQEKTAPYLVSVFEPDQLALEMGRHYNRVARLTYADCVKNGIWPGYSDDVELIGMPPWAQNLYFQETGK